MVTALFLVALVSFALMGLFVVALTIYSGLKRRAERVDEAADELAGRFTARRGLLPEVEEFARGHAAPEVGDRLASLRARAGASRAFTAQAELDVDIRRCLGEVLGRGALPGVPAERVLPLLRRLEQTDVDVSSGLRAYNMAVTELKQARSLVPGALVARFVGLGDRPLVDGASRLPVRSGAGAADRRPRSTP
jgi:hypothetical protein